MRRVTEARDFLRRISADGRRRRYERTMDERRAAVERVIGGEAIVRVAMDVGVTEQTIKTWIDQMERATTRLVEGRDLFAWERRWIGNGGAS